MVRETLLASGVVSLLAAAAFAYVGWLLWQRHVTAANRVAARAFTTYWLGLAAYTGVGGVESVVASFGVAPFPLFLALRYLTIPLLCATIGAVVFYFVFLYTGREAWRRVVTVVYGFVGVTGLYYVWSREPIGVAVSEWRTDLAYAADYESPFFTLILLMLVLPQLVGAVAYAALIPRTPRASQRYRIALVSSVIFVWGVAALVARLAASSGFVQLLTRPVLGLVVVAAVLLAYRPPRALRERWARQEAPE